MAILLGCAEDGAAVDGALREGLLELCLLSGLVLVELIEHDDEVVAQRHVLVELVGEVHVVEEVLLKVGRQQPAAEDGFAATLVANQGGNGLVAVEQIQAKSRYEHGRMDVRT